MQICGFTCKTYRSIWQSFQSTSSPRISLPANITSTMNSSASSSHPAKAAFVIDSERTCQLLEWIKKWRNRCFDCITPACDPKQRKIWIIPKSKIMKNSKMQNINCCYLPKNWKYDVWDFQMKVIFVFRFSKIWML